jgi:hypothetical protein
MSGRRATVGTDRVAGAPGPARRTRAIAVVAAVVSLGLCGAVAQASSDPAPHAGDVREPKVAAAPTTTEVGGEAAPPDGLGTDPELDALAQSCFDGDLVACDHLFLRSPIDSPYEGYGDTCAGRQAAGTGRYCGLDTAAPSGEPIPPEGLGTDPDLDALAQLCYSGDMDACDELYGSADSGSAYQIYGDTCAGRQPENTGSYCTALEDPVPGTGAVPVSTSVPPTTVFGDTTTVVDASTTTQPVDTTQPIEPSDVPAPTIEPTGLGDDPTLDALAQSCYDGDLAACDDLYRGADPGTPYRSYGDTCAGRQAENSGTWCVAAFGPDSTDTVVVESSETPTVPPSTTTSTTLPATPVTTTPPPTSGPAETAVPGAIPPPTLEPTGLGTDPALDQLAQSCYDGDMAACDDLWRDSEAGSDYRNFGDTCAGRQRSNSGTWCEDAFAVDATTPSTNTLAPTTVPGETTPASIPPATEQPTGLGDDPTFDALAQLCFDGDMLACDELFDFAPMGSDYRSYGDTCAGRQAPGTFNYCHLVFPASD